MIFYRVLLWLTGLELKIPRDLSSICILDPEGVALKIFFFLY